MRVCLLLLKLRRQYRSGQYPPPPRQDPATRPATSQAHMPRVGRLSLVSQRQAQSSENYKSLRFFGGCNFDDILQFSAIDIERI